MDGEFLSAVIMRSLTFPTVALIAITLGPSASGAQQHRASGPVAVRLLATYATGFAFGYPAAGGGRGRLSDGYGAGAQLLVHTPWLLAPYIDYRLLSATLEIRNFFFPQTTRISYSTLGLGIQLPIPLFKIFTATAGAGVERTIGAATPSYTTTAVAVALEISLSTHLALHGQLVFASEVETAHWRRNDVLLLEDPAFRRELLGLSWYF
jgi:hypothetical protein